MRICAAVRQEYGHAALAKFYTALWTNEGAGEQDWLRSLRNALERAGLPKSLTEAGTSTAFDEAVSASHDEAIGLVGGHVGTPVIAVEEEGGRGGETTAFFGSVISQVPTGEGAGRLWDGVLLVASTPGFHELQAAARETSP